MTHWLIDLPLVWGLLLFVVIIVAAGDIIYVAVYHLFAKSVLSKKHKDVSKLLFRTAASLLGLLLSFTLANQRVDYFTIKSSIQAEASKMVDIHVDLALFATPEAAAIQRQVRDYIGVTLDEGWGAITASPFDSKSAKAFMSLYRAIHQLEPVNPHQEQLKSSLLSDIDEVSDYMQVRFYKARPETPHLFYVAFLGYAIVMILFAAYEPDRISLIFLSLYNIFIGIVLYFIVMMNNPLIGPMQVKAEPFEILQETIKAKFKD
ncbi:MAG: DUF4239 domain-containing protein [Cyclobacteriaceae bacterium]|nr:DUF4239 domain-containing protein [Cyclobacteriaceae bacterium]